MTYTCGLVMKMSHLMQNYKTATFHRLTHIITLEFEIFQKFLMRGSVQLKQHSIPNINQHFKLVSQRQQHLTNFSEQSQRTESADRTVLCGVWLAAEVKKILMLSDKFFHCKL